MGRVDALEESAPQARRPELGRSTDAWHQVGNDHVVATAFNHGYTQLWSHDRSYEWVNHYDPDSGHYAGGYGYLNVGGHSYSTLCLHRPRGATPQRDFGVGYVRSALRAGGLAVERARDRLGGQLVKAGARIPAATGMNCLMAASRDTSDCSTHHRPTW